MYAANLQQPAGRSYEIIRQLAVGGMGVVSLARDSAGKLVVLKRPIGRSPSDKKRLVDEATIGLRLVHPAIVRTIELFRDQDQPVLVLEYVQGLTLAELRSFAPLAPPLVCLIGAQLAEGIAAIHRATDDTGRPLNILHRDITPGNIILGSDGQARLIDMGIARSDENIATRTAAGDLRGTVRYLAPELFQNGTQSTGSDIWALGIVLVEAATGQPLYRGSTVEIIASILHQPPLERVPAAQLDPLLRETLEPLLAVDLETRAGAASAVAERLAAAAARGGATLAQLIEVVAQAQQAAYDSKANDNAETESWAQLLDPRELTGHLATKSTAARPGFFFATVLTSLQRASRVRSAALAVALVSTIVAAGYVSLLLNVESAEAESPTRTPDFSEAFARKAARQEGERQASKQEADRWAAVQDAEFEQAIGAHASKSEVIAKGAEWRYDDRGVELGTEWHKPRYDDSVWPTGRGRFGYGGDGEQTVLDFGSDPQDKRPVAYFRKTLHVTNAKAISRLALRFVRDDGAAIYINGIEVARHNLIPNAQFAMGRYVEESAMSDEEQLYFPIIAPASMLVNGVNVVAAEVRQRSKNSSDLGFDLQLFFVIDR